MTLKRILTVLLILLAVTTTAWATKKEVIFKYDPELANFYERNPNPSVWQSVEELKYTPDLEFYYDAYVTYDIWKHSGPGDDNWQSTGKPGDTPTYTTPFQIPYIYESLNPYDFKVTYNPTLFEAFDRIYKARVAGFLNGSGDELNSDSIKYSNGTVNITQQIKLEGVETKEGFNKKEDWQGSTVQGWRFYVPFTISWKYKNQIPNDLAVQNLTCSQTKYKPGEKLVFEWDFVNHGQTAITDSEPEVWVHVFANGKQINTWKLENLEGRTFSLGASGNVVWSPPVASHMSYGYDIPKTGAPDNLNFEVRINMVPKASRVMKENTYDNNVAALKVLGIQQTILPPKPFIGCDRLINVYIGTTQKITGGVSNPNNYPVVCDYVLKANGQVVNRGSGVIPAKKYISVSGDWAVPSTYKPGENLAFTLEATIWPQATVEGSTSDYVLHKQANAWHLKGSPSASGRAECLNNAIPVEREPGEVHLAPSVIVD